MFPSPRSTALCLPRSTASPSVQHNACISNHSDQLLHLTWLWEEELPDPPSHSFWAPGNRNTHIWHTRKLDSCPMLFLPKCSNNFLRWIPTADFGDIVLINLRKGYLHKHLPRHTVQLQKKFSPTNWKICHMFLVRIRFLVGFDMKGNICKSNTSIS